jgi:hypothetical protein
MKITKTQLNQIIKEEIENLKEENLKEGFLTDLIKAQATEYVCGTLSEKVKAAVNLKDFLPFEIPEFVELMFDKWLGNAVCSFGKQMIEEAATNKDLIDFVSKLDTSGLFENLEEEKINGDNT